MARKVEISLVDDLDGGAATESIVFGIDGEHYEIDLGEKNAAKFREVLKPYIKAGQPSSQFSAKEAPAIRAWAKAQGLEVSARGRLNAEVIAAYREANK